MKKSLKTRHLSVIAVGLVAALAFFLFLICSDTAIEYMKKGLKLCAATVIPSLFPFMVISELLVSCGVGRLMGRWLARPFKWLFGVSEDCACAFTLGTVCGFPIGARVLCSMYDRGEISKGEAERAMTFCNNPGSAFVMSAVGLSLIGNRAVGIMLYVCVIFSALCVGILGRFFFKNDGGEAKSGDLRKRDRQTGAESKSLSAQGLTSDKTKKPDNHPCHKDFSGVEIFTHAVGSSASSMLTVCAFVAFFSSFIGCVGSVLQKASVAKETVAAIFAFFELSSGVGMAAELNSPTQTIIMCAAALGWSGLSVHLQIATICSGRGLSMLPYLIAKAAQGVICTATVAVILRFFPFSDSVFQSFGEASSQSLSVSANHLCLAFFIASLLPLAIKEKSNCLKQ